MFIGIMIIMKGKQRKIIKESLEQSIREGMKEMQSLEISDTREMKSILNRLIDLVDAFEGIAKPIEQLVRKCIPKEELTSNDTKIEDKNVELHQIEGERTGVFRELCKALLKAVQRDGEVKNVTCLAKEMSDEYKIKSIKGQDMKFGSLKQYLYISSSYVRDQGWLKSEDNSLLKGEKYSEGLKDFGIPDIDGMRDFSERHKQDCINQLRNRG